MLKLLHQNRSKRKFGIGSARVLPRFIFLKNEALKNFSF